jgi:osmotically-inducible protein OsmY
MKRTIGYTLAAGFVLAMLDGCALLIGGAAVGGTVVVADRRPAGIQMEDTRIGTEVRRVLKDSIPRDSMNITVTIYNRRVLLAGQVKTPEQRALAGSVAAKVENVQEVFNEVTVGELATSGDRTDDTLLGGKVKAALLGTKGVPPEVVKTTVEQGVVYLLGKVSASEGEAAATAASKVNGVRRVVKLFEVISDKEVAAIKKGQAESPNGAKNEGTP